MSSQWMTKLALLAVLLPLTTVAHEGDSHDVRPPAAATAAAPRFTAHSARIEMVGVVDGRQVTLYLDRFEDNTPVTGAAVGLAIGGAEVPVTLRSPGEFHGETKRALEPGAWPVVATVSGIDATDRLDAVLDIHGADGVDDAHAHGPGSAIASAAAAVAAVLALGWWGRRTLLRRRAGGAA